MTNKNDDRLNNAQKKFLSTFSQMGHKQILDQDLKKDFFRQMDSMMENGRFTHFFKHKFSLSKSLLKVINSKSNDEKTNWFDY